MQSTYIGARGNLESDRQSEHPLDALGDEIAESAAHIDAATHGLLRRIREFDEKEGWARQGALSCARWLCWRIGLDIGTAREKIRVARALGELPSIDESFSRGQLSYSKVRAMTRVATPENEETLLTMAKCATGAQLERICRGFRQVTSNLEGQNPAESAEAERYVRRRRTASGLVRIEAQLLPDEAEVVFKALRTALSAWRAENAATTDGQPASENRAGALPRNRRRAPSRWTLPRNRRRAPTEKAFPRNRRQAPSETAFLRKRRRRRPAWRMAWCSWRKAFWPGVSRRGRAGVDMSSSFTCRTVLLSRSRVAAGGAQSFRMAPGYRKPRYCASRAMPDWSRFATDRTARRWTWDDEHGPSRPPCREHSAFATVDVGSRAAGGAPSSMDTTSSTGPRVERRSWGISFKSVIPTT